MDDLNRNTDVGAPDAEANREAQRLRDEERRAADLRRDDVNAGDEIGEAVGGISGVLTGAALGSLGGPVGTIIGGIAGAVSGWWAGRAISEAASHVTHDDEDYYRHHYERSPNRLADRSYDDVRPAYQIGHLAGRNPDYAERRFEDVESDLQRGWSSDVSQRHGPWNQVRDYARHAFDRGRGFATGAVAGSATTSEREFDRVSDSPASGTGYGASAGGPTGIASGASTTPDRTSGGASLGGTANDTSASLGGTSGAGASTRGDAFGAADRAQYETNAASPRLDDSIARAGGPSDASWDRPRPADPGLGQRVANAADDLKDRIDGNPASRPGPDATDRPARLDASGSIDRPTTLGAAGAAGAGIAGAADRAGAHVENAWDRTKDAASNLGHRAANAADDLKDRVDGNPASRPGPDATDHTRLSSTGTFDRTEHRAENAADRLGDRAENAWDRTKDAAKDLGHRVANAADDVKDRVDGNPASRPGPDATDRPDRRY